VRRRVDITGQRFGLLTAARVVGSGIDKATMWLCSCDCGGERLVTAGKLRNGAVTQCGCISKRAPKQKPVEVIADVPRATLDYFLYQYQPSNLEI
jgi:hypothetical protein